MIKNMSLSFILVLAVLLSACSSPLNIFSRCPDADINWADVLMINDVLYEGLLEGGTYERGKKIGED